MLIKSYEKKANGLYKVYIDDDNYLVSEEVIIKYKLLYKKEISSEEFNDILDEFLITIIFYYLHNYF